MKRKKENEMSGNVKLFFIILALILIIGTAYLVLNNSYINLNGVQVSNQLYNQLSSTDGDFRICKISDNNCLILRRIK